MEKFKLEKVANHERMWNASYGGTDIGMKQIIDTQTQIVAGVVETKYYELLGQSLSDFITVDVGTGADSLNIFQFTSSYTGSNFEECLVDVNNGLQKNAVSDIQIGGFNIPVNFFRNDYTISQTMLDVASKNVVSFSLVEAKEKARKKLWDLGIQKCLFLGLQGRTDTYGLLTQPSVSVNTSLITKPLSTMTGDELKTFVGTLVGTYVANANGTVLPNCFHVPQADFLGLGAPVSGTYPIKTVREVLDDAFRGAGISDMKIVHTKYAETASSTGKARYTLYRVDAESLKMFIPKEYTPSALYPLNGQDFISVAVGQFTGAVSFRPAEMLYLDIA